MEYKRRRAPATRDKLPPTRSGADRLYAKLSAGPEGRKCALNCDDKTKVDNLSVMINLALSRSEACKLQRKLAIIYRRLIAFVKIVALVILSKSDPVTTRSGPARGSLLLSKSDSSRFYAKCEQSRLPKDKRHAYQRQRPPMMRDK